MRRLPGSIAAARHAAVSVWISGCRTASFAARCISKRDASAARSVPRVLADGEYSERGSVMPRAARYRRASAILRSSTLSRSVTIAGPAAGFILAGLVIVAVFALGSSVTFYLSEYYIPWWRITRGGPLADNPNLFVLIDFAGRIMRRMRRKGA